MIKTASKFKLSILLYMLDLSKSTRGDGEVTSLWEWNSMDAELVSETDYVFLAFELNLSILKELCHALRILKSLP